jgi:hypothetical protein
MVKVNKKPLLDECAITTQLMNDLKGVSNRDYHDAATTSFDQDNPGALPAGWRPGSPARLAHMGG